MKSSKAMILAVMNAILAIASITARITALLDFISAVQYTMVRNRCFFSHIGHRDVKNFSNDMKLCRIVA